MNSITGTIAEAKENLREHLESDIWEVAPSYIRELAMAYITPGITEPITELINGIRMGNENDGTIATGFVQSVRSAVRVALNQPFGRAHSVYIAHVAIGEWQPALATLAQLEHPTRDDHTILPNCESLMLDYGRGGGVEFAILSGEQDLGASNAYSAAESLLELPDDPVYLPLVNSLRASQRGL